MGTKMREEEVDDYDCFENVPEGTVFEPFQGMVQNEWTHRQQKPRSSLLPAPPGAQLHLNGPFGQFMPPIKMNNLHGANAGVAHSSSPNSELEASQQQWADYWQMAFYDFWRTYNVGRTAMNSSAHANQVQQQLLPQRSNSHHNKANQQQWNLGFNDNASTASNAPMSRENAAFGFADSSRAYSGRNDAANSSRVNSARSSQYLLHQHNQQQQPRPINAHSNCGGTWNEQMKPGKGTHAATNINFVNQHPMQSGAGKRNAALGNAGERQYEKGGHEKKLPPFFEHEVVAQDHKNLSSNVADSNDEWYEFDSTDLRPSRGNANQSRSTAARDGFANKGSAPQRARGGGYMQRPPMSSVNNGNKNGKNFY